VATVTPPGLKIQLKLRFRPRTWHLWVALVTTERSQLLFMECIGEIKWYLLVVTFSLTIEHIKQERLDKENRKKYDNMSTERQDSFSFPLGKLLTDNLGSYKVPTVRDIPNEMSVVLLGD
jgi:hypothetical protein